MAEEWRAVVGGDGRYEVSNLGRVRRIARRILAPADDGHGYRRFAVKAFERKKMWMVHRLVAAAFIGPCPAGYEVNHIDSNRSNNAVENLEYVTKRENALHSFRVGGRPASHRGTETNFAKLTDMDVIHIRRLRGEGRTYKQIAAHFNTKPANVWHICMGRTWKHLL